MTLLTELRYTDPHGEVWVAPIGSVVDGASIPRYLWSIMGGPFEGRYRNASVLHDVAYGEHKRPWKDCDRMFYYAMRPLFSTSASLRSCTPVHALLSTTGSDIPRNAKVAKSNTRMRPLPYVASEYVEQTTISGRPSPSRSPIAGPKNGPSKSRFCHFMSCAPVVFATYR